jgi:hypothetical protein
MERKSMEKLMQAGYTFIRTDDQPNIRIKYREKGSGDWKTLEKFDTKAARDRKFSQLLDLSLFITDSN